MSESELGSTDLLDDAAVLVELLLVLDVVRALPVLDLVALPLQLLDLLLEVVLQLVALVVRRRLGHALLDRLELLAALVDAPEHLLHLVVQLALLRHDSPVALSLLLLLLLLRSSPDAASW